MNTSQKIITQSVYPINFFCCKRPDHFIPDNSNRYQYCRMCHWVFNADLFICDEKAYKWIYEDIRKKENREGL